MGDNSSDSNSDEKLYLMTIGIVTAIKSKKKRKHRYWVREIYRNRDVDGVNSFVSTMRVSNRDSLALLSLYNGELL